MVLLLSGPGLSIAAMLRLYDPRHLYWSTEQIRECSDGPEWVRFMLKVPDNAQ